MTEYEKQSLELLKLICSKLDDISSNLHDDRQLTHINSNTGDTVTELRNVVRSLKVNQSLETDKTDY